MITSNNLTNLLCGGFRLGLRPLNRHVGPGNWFKRCSTGISHRTRKPPPQWLKDLEVRQTGRKSSESTATGSGWSPGEEVTIYLAKMKDNWRGSANQVGFSVISLIFASGYIAQQIRHHGAGPVWPNPKSDWMDFELKPWEKSTRVLLAVGVITIATFKSLGFLLTLSHTIRRITVRLPDQLDDKTHRSIKKFIKPQTVLEFHSIGSQDLIFPLRKLFLPRTLKPSELLSFGRLTDRPNVKATGIADKTVKGGLIPLKPIDGGLALQLPLDGIWGTPDAENSSPEQVKASLEDAFEYPDLKDPMLHYKIGFDPRQPVRFNLNVLACYLQVLREKILG